jgi:RNA polymerase subunit RPABC4/transcription elongation factor Spt4
MISKYRAREALERLSNNLNLGVNKHDQIQWQLQEGTIEDNKEFVNDMATEEAKDIYQIHGWDDGLHGPPPGLCDASMVTYWCKTCDHRWIGEPKCPMCSPHEKGGDEIMPPRCSKCDGEIYDSDIMCPHCGHHVALEKARDRIVVLESALHGWKKSNVALEAEMAALKAKFNTAAKVIAGGMDIAEERDRLKADLAAARELIELGMDEKVKADRLRAALEEMRKTLLIPAAEYVPAINDALDIIDRALSCEGDGP